MILNFTTLWANTADDKLMIFLLLFTFSRKVDNLHEMLKTMCIFNTLSTVEIFTQHDKH